MIQRFGHALIIVGDERKCHLLNKILTERQYCLIARLFGVVLRNGLLRDDACEIIVNTKEDTFNIVDDMIELGFSAPDITINEVYTITCTKSFTYFMNMAISKSGLPKWLTKSYPRVKREFLSAIRIHGNKIKLKLGKSVMKSLQQLLEDFGIQSSINKNTLHIGNTLDNMCLYNDYIGFRYNTKNMLHNIAWAEYLR